MSVVWCDVMRCNVMQYTGMPMMDVKVHMMSIPIDMNGNIVPNGQAPGQGQGQRPNNGNTESASKVSQCGARCQPSNHISCVFDDFYCPTWFIIFNFDFFCDAHSPLILLNAMNVTNVTKWVAVLSILIFILPYLTLPCLTLPYPTLPYLTSPYLTQPHLTLLPCLALPYERYTMLSPSIEGFLRFITSLWREKRIRKRNEGKQTIEERRRKKYTGYVVFKGNKRCHDPRSCQEG